MTPRIASGIDVERQEGLGEQLIILNDANIAALLGDEYAPVLAATSIAWWGS